MERHDSTDHQGRKGVAYDWQSVLVDAQARDLDAELTELLAANA
jgi:hypothetical protein